MSITALGLALFVWSSFILSLVAALLHSYDALLSSYWEVALDVHLAGLVILPVFAVISFCLASRGRWIVPTLAALYLLTTLLIYPLAVQRYLAIYPGNPGWHWTSGSFFDYQYIENNPIGDPQYSGRVNLIPPYFQIPPQNSK